MTAALAAAVILPRMAHRGMFVDGVTYASIARNLAEGRGRFWAPSYTATIYPEFHEHLPLALWIQSLWFRLLGDHLYVERVYSLTMAVATAALLAAIWRHAYREREAAPLFQVEDRGKGVRLLFLEWWPILLWIAVPVVSWAIVGNLLETTMALFTTAAVFAVVKGLGVERGNSAVQWGMVSGLLIVAATLAKGPVGLFPLAAPATLALLPESRRVGVVLTAQWTTVAATAMLLLAFGASRSSLIAYIDVQLLPAISGQREVSAASMTIVKALVAGVVLPILGLALLTTAGAGRFVAPSTADRRRATAFALLALAGTLPIMMSAKQAGHYLVPAVPIFALAAASAMAPTAAALAQRCATAGALWVRGVTVLLTLVAVAGIWVPGLDRDRSRLVNLDVLEYAVPRGETIGICPSANSDWGLHAWFERRFHVSLDATAGRRHEWFLETDQREAACAPMPCPQVAGSGEPLSLKRCDRRD